MPEKYHIEVDPTAPRFAPVSKLNHLEHNRCLGCLECAKRDCIYDVFAGRRLLPRELVDSGSRLCKACMRCVQECRNRIMLKALNPEYLELGNDYWTPEIITSLWNQAETGKIPVSGAGYGGPFSGAGFDEMWTDMSEIVRPTRDGIHGREYINTSIDIGARPDRLHFKEGQLNDDLPPSVSIPLPLVLDLPPRARRWLPVKNALLHAARQLKILALDDEHKLPDENAVARFAPEDFFASGQSHRFAEICLDSSDPEAARRLAVRLRAAMRQKPDTVVAVALPLDRNAREAALCLAEHGVGVLRFYAGRDGNELEKNAPRFIKEAVRDIHLAFVQARRRDCVTLLAGGGIAMAEHVAKLIACGADGVVVDEALLVALECRLCPSCAAGDCCRVEIEKADAAWAAQRIVNLLGSWHSQLIEVMGAMGIREIRRLRGEVGRVMFFKDLEKECFAPIFGERVESK
ncbi:MAG: glutamate synthase-related protein [Kiritimatiellia bacterium]